VQIPLLALAANLDGWPMLIVALCMMMAIFGQIPLNDAIVGKYVADEYRARVLSVRYVVSLGVASVAVPMIALLHRTEGGFRNVFLVLAALAIAVMTAAFFFPSKERLRQAPAAAT
jgi:MFS family permease